MGFFEYFSSRETEQIHTATLTVLEKTGMNFKYEPALDLFKKAGCKVDGVRVFFTRKFVEEQIKKAPSQFTLYARNPEKNVAIGGDNIAFMPCYGSPFVNCLDHGRRPGTLEDFKNFAKLACAIPYFDITGGMMVEPNDIPVEIRNAERIYAAMTLSDKPFMGAGTNGPDAVQTLDMASIVFGSREEMAKKPPFVSILTSLTPLGFDDKMCAGIMAYAEAAMPQLISSLSIAGATTPVTMEGTLVVQNAEVLAGICLAQLVREGAPVIFAGSSSAAAMHYGTLSIGAPEMAVNTAATAQMGRFYHLPSRGGGALTDAKTVDAIDSEIIIPKPFNTVTADVVVIGGGIVGAATAFWLSKAGIKTILVEKRDALSSLTTAASAECFRTQFTEKPMAELALTSVEMFENFRDVVGLPHIDIHVTQRGYLFVTDDESQLPDLKKAVDQFHANGVTGAEYIGKHDLHKRFPFLAPEALGATFNERDGWLSTHEATYGFAKGAADARFFMKTEVTGIQTDSQGVCAVETDKGTISTRVVVNCAGPYAGVIGKMAGLDLPVRTVRRQKAYIKTDYAGLPASAPFTVDLVNHGY